jgi:hypothetical protein
MPFPLSTQHSLLSNLSYEMLFELEEAPFLGSTLSPVIRKNYGNDTLQSTGASPLLLLGNISGLVHAEV